MIDREHAITLLVQRMLEADPRPAPAVWLGALEPWWAWEGRAAGRLILSARRILRRRSGGRGRLRRAVVPLFIDSGAFSEVSTHGGWTWPAHDFAAFVEASARELGTVEHAGIQDWMCEPWIVEKTGLTVEEHQRRTIASFLELRRLAPAVPWVFTLQGYTARDYLRCAQMGEDEGIRLEDEALVGLGSVCRRSRTPEIEATVAEVKAGLPSRVRLHGYGVKSEGAMLACWGLASVDSMAWSRRARGLESNLRAALGLPVDAPSDQVLAATDEQLAVVDLDLVDFLAWKRERCPRTAAASLDFAEGWRAHQLLGLAGRLVDALFAEPGAPAAARAEQLLLGLAAAPPPTRPAVPRARLTAAPGARPAPGQPGAPTGPVQGLLLGGPTP